jgi:hypothetical protein
MSDTRVFNESVFNSFETLQNFLLRSNAIDQVLSRKDKPFSKVLSPLNPNLACHWQVSQIATAPFRWMLAIVLQIVAKTAAFLEATSFAKQVKTGSQYLEAGFDICSDTPTKLFRIKNSINHPNTQGKVVSKTPFIPESRITNTRVKKRTFCSLHKGVKFNHNQGICRGMSYWFLYLYLKTKTQFSDPRSHMAALGRQFVEGGGVDPTLLQSVYLRKGKLLNMQITAPHVTPEHIMNKPLNIPAGAYTIALPRHMMAYVKIHDKLGFFFDPNHGITEINGEAVDKKFYELVIGALEDTEGVPSKPGHPIFHIGITPVTLRS